MLAAAYEVRIERHEVGVIPLWSFVAAGAPERPPLVFVLHGLNSRKERHLDLCLRLAGVGLRACAVDSRSHGERMDGDTWALHQPWASAEFTDAFTRVVSGTIEDVAALASYLAAGTYAIVGHSMGGYIATLAAISDPRALVVVNVAGSLDLSALATQGDPSNRRWDLVARAAELRLRAVMLLHGDSDETVPVSGARRLHKALRAAYADDPSRVAYIEYAGIGHELTPTMMDEAVAWIRRHLSTEVLRG